MTRAAVSTRNRFAIAKGGTTLKLLRDDYSPLAALSVALTYAMRDETGGIWYVREYEDVLYRIRREPGKRSRVTVEGTA